MWFQLGDEDDADLDGYTSGRHHHEIGAVPCRCIDAGRPTLRDAVLAAATRVVTCWKAWRSCWPRCSKPISAVSSAIDPVEIVYDICLGELTDLS